MAAAGPPWGWHRLDQPWVERLVADAGIHPGDLVLDIGAGDGNITTRLLEVGARVIAVELHPARADALRHRFRNDAVVVIHVDATELRLPSRPFKVVANPPFGITTALLRRLTTPRSALVSANLVLPSYAVRRWTAGRGCCGALSKQIFRFEERGRVPVRAFRPQPPRAAEILAITRRSLRR